MINPSISIEMADGRRVDTDLATIKRAARAVDRDPRQIEAFTPEESGIAAAGSIAADQLKSFVERIERLEEGKKAVADDIKDVYAEAKGNGFDVKILRQVIRIRKQDKSEREEMAAILDLYMQALGMSYGKVEG